MVMTPDNDRFCPTVILGSILLPRATAKSSHFRLLRRATSFTELILRAFSPDGPNKRENFFGATVKSHTEMPAWRR
jgi:hypothetical protein